MGTRALVAVAAAAVAVLAGVLVATADRGPDVPASLGTPGPTAPPSSAPPSAASPDAPAVLLAAGDIADCGGGAAATGRLLSGLDGVVAPLGDLVYPAGSPARYDSCYDPTWGHARDRTRPAQGNHDVITAGAPGLYGYFGDAAGPEPQGYYSYPLGDWHVVVLNSNCGHVGGCGADDPQGRWLRDDLAAAAAANIVAYWHHPRFSTGAHGDDERTTAFWQILHGGGVDLILNGHDHDYQRFAPLDAAGRPDPGGIRQFVVGTGGAGLRPFGAPARPRVEARSSDHHGILRLELAACGYRWQFLATDGTTVDAGDHSGTCDN